MNFDKESQYIFNSFVNGDINRQEFYDGYEALYSRISSKDKQNLERRLDKTKNQKGRSLGQFALHIYDSTIREKVLINAWASQMLEELFIQNNGIDNSGIVLLNVTNSKPDYILYSKGGWLLPDGNHPIEIKFAPGFNKLTYKVENLKSYLKSNSYVLTIINSGKMGASGNIDHDGSIDLDFSLMGWVLFDPSKIQQLLNEVEHKHYFELGNKLAIQIQKKDFDKYFQVHKWKEA